MTSNTTPADRASVARPIGILLVEDHLMTRIGLRTLLANYDQLRVVGEAGSVAEGVREALRTRPDVILLDVRLPDGNGFDACRQLQQAGGDFRVLILTSFADDDTLFQCLAVGADGYLLKDIDPAGLVRAIENVAAGNSILDPAVTRKVLNRLRTSAAAAPQGDRLKLLSPQELRVLERVAEGRTNKEIAAELGLSDKTVKHYLSNTLDKLQVTRRSKAAALYVQHRQESVAASTGPRRE
ncbi:MAG: response regulator transcription factor [Verrucomicrobiota bacterium]